MSLHFLSFALPKRWLTPKPKPNKCHPSRNCDPDPSNPYPTSANLPTAWPLIMRKMSDGDLSFDINIGEEGSFVVDAKGKDAVLVW